MDNKKQELFKLLKKYYGFNSFRPGQEQVIDNIIGEKSTIVIMPTGGGKSLCFQLPALILDGVTIVISPLIALMKDQVDALQKNNIPATFINSSLTPAETYSRLEAVKNKQYKLLYIAPERFYSREFINALTQIKVSLFAIDEAHCISQWGHDFRPSYIKLRDAIKKTGSPTVVALTATATPKVREDIIKQLDLDSPSVVITGFARPNLQFGVVHAKETQKPEYVLNAVKKMPDSSGIVYVSTRARADQLTQILLENDIEAVSYHAGMETSDRKWVQDNFLSGRAKVIVATNAFGLGIDKPDIRFVIHYDLPGTIEAYYQEAGRAGRDGRASFCLLLYNKRGRHLQEFFIKGDNPPPKIILELYEILKNFETDKILITYAELSEMLSENLPDMAIGTSLKILEREGYISRSRERSGNAYLKLKKPADYILDSLGSRAKKQIEIFNKLYKKFADDLVNGWQANFSEVAEILGIKKEALARLVRKLADHDLVEYQPPFKGTEIKVLKRVQSEEVKIDKEGLRSKERAAYQKLDKIEEYAYYEGCRQEFILNYFGEKDVVACGKCDNCLGARGYKRKTSRPERAPKFREKYFEKIKIKPKTSSLPTKLTQLETFDLYTKGMAIKDIAANRGLNRDTVINHLCYLIAKGLPIDINKLVSPEKQKKIKQAANKLGRKKLTPIKEYLGNNINWEDIKLTLAWTEKNG